MTKLLIVWGNWGPYHYARFTALHEQGLRSGIDVHGLEVIPASDLYAWETPPSHPAVHHLKIGDAEMDFRPWLLLTKLLPFLAKRRPDVILVPSYWHWSLVINYLGRLLGAKIVMMNESHGGTQKADGWKLGLKRKIIRHFHAGFVGGTPHQRYFASMGLAADKIFCGYDAIDNSYFARRSQEARAQAEALREQFKLPEHYFLNLGRMVKKKNLPLLLRAYALLRKRRADLTHDLVFVGSGEEEPSLRQLCGSLGLAVADHTDGKATTSRRHSERRDLAIAGASHSSPPAPVRHEPTVHFYGFRQIQENPVFYALASAFILPSTTEEWGLVVNEAMACSLPVLVSNRVGCAEDLVAEGENGFTFDPSSVDELAAALERVADPAVAGRLGSASRARIAQWGCDRFASGALAAAAAALGKTSQPL